MALPQVPVVFAGPVVQSALVQQPAVATHRLVFGQFLNPMLQVIPHIPVVALHTAMPFDIGDAQPLQAGPQKLVLVSDWQTPAQLCVPVGHMPLQAIALAMHAPLHNLLPVGHDGTQARPSHVTIPPPPGV